MSKYEVEIEGLKNLDEFMSFGKDINKTASQAINFSAKKGKSLSIKEIQRQVNFPSNYFSGDKSRVRIKGFASVNSLEATIAGRARATSLARFATQLPNNKGVIIQVKPGKSKVIKSAFLINLKSGSGSVDTKNNLGLAVRTKGEKPSKAYKPVKLAPNLYLLYGPSVNQVFGNEKGVANKISPEVLSALENEFLRLLEI